MYEDTQVEDRLDSLETILGTFIVQTNVSFKKLSNGMKDFKDEMKDFKDEMKDFKDEMKDFKDEMKDFKDEMKDFKEEMRQDHKNSNKKWGNLANKLGTLVEDIVAPAVGPVIEKYFHQEVTYIGVNIRKKNKALHLKSEFDVIAETDEKVFIVETKSSPRPEYLDVFVDKIEVFKQLFPQYPPKMIIPIFASLRFEDEIVQLASEKKVYAMAYREWDYMDILNFEEIDA